MTYVLRLLCNQVLILAISLLAFLHAETADHTIVDLSKSSMTLVQIATNPAYSLQAVMDLPFRTFFMWIDPPRLFTNTAVVNGIFKKQISDFTEYLMRRYQGTGKTFMLGVLPHGALYSVSSVGSHGLSCVGHVLIQNCLGTVVSNQMAATQLCWS